jgi:phytoene dehydrogenase-like protein
MAAKVLIAGAGIAGLSAAVYARKNGFEAVVFESHSVPGGLCTSWERKGYTFDGCLHWLTGSSPADSFYQLWDELGVIRGRKFHDHDVFYRVTGSDGRTLSAYTDIDRFEAHLLEISPPDRSTIREFCNLVRTMSRFHLPMTKAFELYGPVDMAKMIIRMLPFSRAFLRAGSVTINDYSKRFKDPLLREAFPHLLGDGRYGLASLVITLALLNNRAGGFPLGGSLEFAKSIERRALDLGATIHYRKRVVSVREHGGSVTAVDLADGTREEGDYLVIASDLHAALYDLLGGRHLDARHVELFDRFATLPSSVQVSFGVDMDLSEASPSVGDLWKIGEPIVIGRERHEWVFMKHFSFDASMAPPGKSVAVSLLMTDDFEYWRTLREDRDAYRAEKERIADVIAREIDKRIPGFISAIEVSDVVTPATYHRYTNTWRGSYMSWIQDPQSSAKLRLIPKTVPGLDNCYLAGMWVMAPGGVPTGVKTARDVIEMICRREGRRLVVAL